MDRRGVAEEEERRRRGGRTDEKGRVLGNRIAPMEKIFENRASTGQKVKSVI